MADSIQITLPDGSSKAAPAGIRVGDFVKESIGAGLAKAAVLARFNGQQVDLSRPLAENGKLEVLTTKTPEALETIRHDAAHVVASAVQKLFPGTQVTIGPTVEDGFYYDFYREKPFTPEELQAIEEEANKEVARNLPFVRSEVSVDDAIKLFEGKGETFKVEIIRDIVAKGAKTLTLYSHGDWVDFCLGPHGPSTGRIGVIKLLSTSGAYWRGDHRNPMLQRIYGTAFFDKKDLEAWLKQQEEAKKRDHRKLGTRAGSLRVLPRVARRGLLDPQGHGPLQPPGRRHAALDPRGRLPGAEDPAALQQGAVGDLRPLGQVPGEHVPGARQRDRRARHQPQADELPVAPPLLRFAEAQLPRAAPALLDPGRACTGTRPPAR